MTATTRSVRAGEITLEVAEAGHGGRPLLLLHGFTGAKEDFADHWGWLAERGWHVVAPDLRGHGSSDHPPGADDYSLDLLAADVLALVGELGWDRFVLLGHSMGGIVSQAIAVGHPDRLDALVLMDTIPGPVSGGGLSLLVVRAAGRLFSLKTMARFARKAPPRAPESVRRLYAERPGYGAEVEAKILASSPVMARSMMADLRSRPDRLPELRSLDLPVLVLAGEHDMAGFVEGSRAMAEAIPGATLVVIDGAAHSPQFETPGAWADAVGGFLDSLPAPGPGAAAALPASGDLTLGEQAALTGGTDMWHSTGIERLAIPSFGLTDGPSGARGFQFTGASSTSMPCGTALASTWNRDLVERVGRVLGDEAGARGASVLLAPTVNIHRHPLGGRNFECYSEDPFLTAEVAVAFICGVQSRGVACAVKHFACNDQETDRMEIDSVVDERTRREIYYPPFEAAVRAGVWSVMAAYNRLDGTHCSQHAGLLTDVLRGEWGFDGVVVSDWFGVHSVDALAAGLDLEMPGPPQWLGEHVVAAVDAGDLDAGVVQRAAQRILDLVERTAASRAERAQGPVADPAQVARTAATEAIVLLSNDGVLPLAADDRPTIALVGWRADQPEVQGGGSAQVTPPYVVTPLQGIVARAEEGTVTYAPGRPVPRSAPLSGRLLSPDAPGGGIELAYFAAGDLSGEPIRTESLPETTAVWLGEPAPDVPAGDFSARMTASFVPDVSGRWSVSVSSIGPTRLFLDGDPLGDNADALPGAGLMGLFTVPVVFEVDLVAGTEHAVVAEFDAPPALGPISLAGMTVAVGPPPQPDAVERAAQAAAAADVAVVVVGLDERVSEGQDSTTMDLPEDQISLIGAVAAANDRTVVVVNAATPVTMDWAEDVAAVVQMSYLGQETGSALAAVLFGDADATGRLTTTYPVRLEDAPAFGHFPGGDGSVAYEEGIFVGYRHYDTKDVAPRWCFGHGRSYTTFAFSEPVVEPDPATGGAVVSVDVTNTGDRLGSEVVQVYVRHVGADVDRPDRELKGFEKVNLGPGETATVAIGLDERAFAHWDTVGHDWRVPPGTYEILVGSSSRAIHRTATWTVEGALPAGT